MHKTSPKKVKNWCLPVLHFCIFITSNKLIPKCSIWMCRCDFVRLCLVSTVWSWITHTHMIYHSGSLLKLFKRIKIQKKSQFFSQTNFFRMYLTSLNVLMLKNVQSAPRIVSFSVFSFTIHMDSGTLRADVKFLWTAHAARDDATLFRSGLVKSVMFVSHFICLSHWQHLRQCQRPLLKSFSTWNLLNIVMILLCTDALGWLLYMRSGVVVGVHILCSVALFMLGRG